MAGSPKEPALGLTLPGILSSLAKHVENQQGGADTGDFAAASLNRLNIIDGRLVCADFPLDFLELLP